jgi:nitrate reductase beta subunit
MYKREEDGIVLVDQAKCRGWRFCVSGCPYKKVYFNHQSGKAEKCTLCFPRIEAGLPTVCSETCVGRIRYLGIVLYDVDRVEAAASTPDPQKLLDAQREVCLDPFDDAVCAQASRDGISDDWLDAARRSPVYALAHRYRVALPLHPEYRTLPMVWYVPPLSPIVNMLETDGYEADPDDVFPAVEKLRIPVDYLANLLTAGDADVIRDVLLRLATMRGYMRKRDVLGEHDAAMVARAGMSVEDVEDMYRLLAIGKYEERYVIPKAHAELGEMLMQQQGTCGLDFEGGPGNCGMVVPESASEVQGFMLGDQPAQLDIVRMAGGPPAPKEQP